MYSLNPFTEDAEADDQLKQSADGSTNLPPGWQVFFMYSS